ncbi:antitoxin [Haemophilus influenzae]|uniref:Antitoxin VapB1 n=1 Tax=Haemophilus influenzae TaxID=727 RepID=A0AAX3IRR1_HAEIF|nr:AbrB/MazE/SpoVT family DNA-binding domain-containing protein [Haemophilus influenzae]RFN96318.1 AbrB/MazE/SpoVT family DNA-binding domain-containing protein [Haemophilus influenzae]VTX59221.1 Antitoxin VapB1 [Haemophilus influenzae]
MERVASLFKNGRSQAVRLPVDFEFNAKQIYIRKEANGDVVLSMRSQQQSSWNKMWSALDNLDTVDFLTPEERRQELSAQDPFEGINL